MYLDLCNYWNDENPEKVTWILKKLRQRIKTGSSDTTLRRILPDLTIEEKVDLAIYWNAEVFKKMKITREWLLNILNNKLEENDLKINEGNKLKVSIEDSLNNNFLIYMLINEKRFPILLYKVKDAFWKIIL